MIGIRGWGLGISLIIFVFLYPIPYTLYPTYAADSTPSADIKIKLEELKKEIASKAAKLKQEVTSKLQNKAYIGTVKTRGQNSLTLATNLGPKIVTTNQDTTFESKVKVKQKFSQKTLAEESSIAALGDIDETQVLTAKKIILLPTPNPRLKTYSWGQIISISDQLATLKDRNLKNVAVSLPASRGEPSSVKLNDFVILTGTKNKNEIFEAEFIYVIPQGGILKPKKIATPSAQISTKSAQPKR